MSIFSATQLALPGVVTLISTLAYGSQILFQSIEPSPLAINEASTFNILVCCIWVCYYQACFTDPGSVPIGWEPQASQNDSTVRTQSKQRWCRKCNAAKPPRAHHCKSCGRYEFRRRLFQLCSSFSNLRYTDVSQRWITIVPGRLTVFLTVPFLISFAFSSTQSSQCANSSISSTSGCLISGTEGICRVYVS